MGQMRYNLFIELTSFYDLFIHLVLLMEYVFFFTLSKSSMYFNVYIL